MDIIYNVLSAFILGAGVILVLISVYFINKLIDKII